MTLRRARNLALIGVLAVLAGTAPDPAFAAPDVVVLPFANYTGQQEAFEKIVPGLVAGLTAMGLEVLDHDAIRPTLRRHRIRSSGQISLTGARLVHEDTGARLALLGSLDLYEPETSLEVSLSARLIDLQNLEVVGAVSVGLTAQETERWFATGRAEDVDAVVDRVLASTLDALAVELRGGRREVSRYHTCGLVAVVPLDDHSGSRYAAEILQSFLMANLVENDWRVVEPGFVREILLDHQVVARGGVTEHVLGLLRERLGVCWVITGEVESFRVATAVGSNAVPALDFGLRLIDARSPRLVSTLQLARDGLQGEGLFGRGREHSMARLTRRCMEDVARWMNREGDRSR